MGTVPQQIEREIEIAAPINRVWAILTEPTHIAAWFGDSVQMGNLRPGAAMVFGWRNDGNFRATAERVEPPRFFSYRWASNSDTDPTTGNSTLVEFTLTEVADGTRLRVVESGFASLDLPEDVQAKAAVENTDGWRSELDDLLRYAEQLAA
jgi:uncharacterized protein YndB with AHSA1/START domain